MDLQNVEIEQLLDGYVAEQGGYQCLHCVQHYSNDEVFPYEGKFYTAQGMIKQHIAVVHGSPFHSMLQLDKKLTGLSDVQIEMMQHFYEQASDQQIVASSSVNSVSTVRQHRFKLREKERQARIFLALMQCLKESTKYEVHKGVKQVDERDGIEHEEREKVLNTYFKDGLDGGITIIPSKEKKKLIILQHILKRFELGHTYNEPEVNAILKTVNADFVSLRRHLIEYGFMERDDEGSQYWVKH